MRSKSAVPVLVVDLGFSAGKYRFNGVEGRVASAFRRHDDAIIVGDEALRGTGSNYLKTPEELVKYYPNFVSHIAKVAGVTSPVSLSIGLPYEFWKYENEKGDDDSSAIMRLKKTLAGGNISKVHVFPQGRGGIVSYLSTAQVPEKSNLLAIDIGFNTIIATLFSVKEQRTIWDATYYKKGVHRMVTEYLYPKIKHLMPGRTATPVELSHFLEERFIQFGFDRHDIGPEIDTSADCYAKDTLGDIVNDLQAHVGVAATFGEVLMFGGGTHYLPDINSQTVKVTKLSDPEFANARGFEILAAHHAEEV